MVGVPVTFTAQYEKGQVVGQNSPFSRQYQQQYQLKKKNKKNQRRYHLQSTYLRCVLCQNALQTLSHVLFTITIGSRNYLLIQMRKPVLFSLAPVIWPIKKWQSWGMNPGLSRSKSSALTHNSCGFAQLPSEVDMSGTSGCPLHT